MTALSWVPKAASIKQHDGNRVVLGVNVRVSPEQIEFGEVPDDTQLFLELQRGGEVHVSADKVGSNVVLHLRHNTIRQPISISDFFTVRVDGGSGRPAIHAGRKRLIVEVDSTQFDLQGESKPIKLKSSGNCTVGGPGKVIEAEMEGGQLHLNCPLEPNAAISGEGQLHIKGGLGEATVDIDGPVHVEGAVDDSKVSAVRFNVKGSVSGSTVEIAGPVHIERSLANSSISTTGDEGWIHVGGSRGESPFDLDELPLDAEPEWWPDPVTKKPPHGKVTDATVSASGDVSCNEVGSSDVTVGGDLTVRFGVSGEGTNLEVLGHAFVGGDLTDACQIVVGGNAALVGDLDGGSTLSSRGSANVNVVNATVTANRLRLRGADAGQVTAQKNIRVVGEVSSECPLKLYGSGTVEETVLSQVSWEPGPDAELVTSALIKTLSVQGIHGKMKAVGPASVETLELDSELHLDWSAGQDSSGIHLLDAGAAGAARLTVHLTQQLTVREVLPPRRGQLEINAVDGDDTSGHLQLEQVRPGRYDLSAVDKVPLHVTCDGGSGDGTSEQEVGETTVEVRATTRITVSGEVTTLVSHGTPVLTVPEDGAVRDLRGTWQLGSVEGRVYGGSYTNRDGAKPPRITAIHKQTDGKGQVAGIDPTHVPFAQLSELAKLHIFDPEAAPLKELAKNIPEDRMDRLQRSEVAHRIAEIVSERASSGSTRSAARWAAARLHHATALTRHERLLRMFHRAVGYSQRPGPAALTWLLTALSLGLLSAAHRSGAQAPLWTGGPWRTLWESRWWDGLTSWGHASVEILFLPARLFRFTAGDGGDLLFGSTLWHVLAFVAVGLPFLFCVLALRNFLISPVDG